MNIVIDSNILFAALLKDSKVRNIILNYEGYFIFPAYIFEELTEHMEELIKKSKLTETEFNKLLHIILRKVIIVPKEMLKPYKEKAIEIIGKIDIDDAVFFACALAYENSIIWSDDKKLKNQDKIQVLNTKEIIHTIEK